MHPASEPPPHRFWTLDAMRGVCALIVFLSHAHLWANFPPRSALEQTVRAVGDVLHNTFTLLAWPTGGNHPAVIAFFVLSGFCIHYPFAQKLHRGTPLPRWRDYYRRRFWRILPVYWLAAALGLLMVWAERGHPSHDALLAFHASGHALDFLARATALTGLYPREVVAGNLTLNTVGAEMILYLAYPAILAAITRRQWTALTAIFLGLQLSILPLFAWLGPFWLFTSFLSLGIFWFAGAALAHRFVHRPSPRGLVWPLLAWSGFLLLKLLPAFPGFSLLKQLAWGLVCVAVVRWLVGREWLRPAPPRSFLVSGLRRVGTISYSLYAVHTPVMLLTSWFLLTSLHTDNYTVQLIALVTVSALASVASYRWVERRFIAPHSSPSISRGAAMRPAGAA